MAVSDLLLTHCLIRAVVSFISLNSGAYTYRTRLKPYSSDSFSLTWALTLLNYHYLDCSLD